MKQLFTHIISGFLLIAISSCNNIASEEKAELKPVEVKDEDENSGYREVEALIEESKNYLESRDFDGDSIYDYVAFSYTGGAHCCYKIAFKLSSSNDTIKYPFEMDGGYGFGIVDGSQHDHFDIDDYDNDGLPEVFMGISTYNGEKSPIDPEWTKQYGIKSNYIIFDFKDGKIVLEDYDVKKHMLKPKRG